jgi:hypothetical protein
VNPFVKAALRFLCEVHIYAWERVLERLDAERPMIDDPLPAGYMHGPIDDFSGFDLGEHDQKWAESRKPTLPGRIR